MVETPDHTHMTEIMSKQQTLIDFSKGKKKTTVTEKTTVTVRITHLRYKDGTEWYHVEYSYSGKDQTTPYHPWNNTTSKYFEEMGGGAIVAKNELTEQAIRILTGEKKPKEFDDFARIMKNMIQLPDELLSPFTGHTTPDHYKMLLKDKFKRFRIFDPTVTATFRLVNNGGNDVECNKNANSTAFLLQLLSLLWD